MSRWTKLTSGRPYTKRGSGLANRRAISSLVERDASHETARHRSGECTRGDVHTNTVEGLFSVFKRGMCGTYQHCKEKHLHRYLAEFDFRYNHRVKLGVNDDARADHALKGIVGKRLTYRTTRN